jgi:serine/threonine-protein kinase
MDRFRSLARTLVEAAALGLLATALLYLPPSRVAPRLDAWLFDGWSQIDPPSPHAQVLLVETETAADLERIRSLAAVGGAKLLISTLPEPPAEQYEWTVGPLEVAVDGVRSRSTDWARGGHLWFQPDLDGVVRRDLSLHAGDLPSLALHAARLIATAENGAGLVDAGSRLLRLPSADAFPSLPKTETATPSSVADRIVIAGSLRPAHATPTGIATAPQLVAQALTSHLGGHYLAESTFATVAAWLAALLLSVPILLGVPAARAATLGLLACATAALLGASLLAFHGLALWLPITGPAAWLLVTSGLLLVRRRQRSDRGPATDADTLARARRAADGGRLKEAWGFYRQLPPNPPLFPEIYDLACALDAAGAHDEAADLYHRIAQSDGDFRDVARRLVRSDHVSGTDDEERVQMPPAIGRYQLLEPIGRGAMGNVYLGRDPLINRLLALKAIDLSIGYESSGLESTMESFLREATIAGSLSHPNIVTIFDVGETDGLAYIAMEYVRGHHLSEFGAPERLLPVATVLDLISRAADALDYAHRRNVVHRDIKPANIMYDSLSNNLKITDFGIAKLIDANRTRTGIVLGTPAFMSPEQLEGKNVNGHTDLFALGVSLYQLLTGQLPFRGASMTNLMFVIANEPHQSVTSVRNGLPTWLDAVIDRALAKDPAERFETAAEMAAALRRAA